MGIDPGRNFGLAIVMPPSTITVLYGTFPKRDKVWRYCIDAYDLVQTVLSRWNNPSSFYVEGAAHKKTYGQPDLEAIRTGFLLSGIHLGFDAQRVPPATVRAEVLGHAHNRAGEFWPELNENAADAVAVALYAMGMRREGSPVRWPVSGEEK